MKTNLVNKENESSKKESSISEIKTLRNTFNETIELGEKSSNSLGEVMKLINVGEAADLIATSLAQLNMANKSKTEKSWMTSLRSIVPFGLLSKAEENVRAGNIKSKPINEVAKDINDAITEKRKSVESMVDGLFELYEKIDTSYWKIKGIKDHINNTIEDGEYEGTDLFHAKILYTEILEYQKIQQNNLKMAKDSIEAVQVSVQQIASMQPRLKAQMNDGFIIRGVVEDLNNLVGTMSAVDGMIEDLQSENREKIASAQLKAIENYTVSKDSLKVLEDNSRRQQQLSLQIENKRKEMMQSVDEKSTFLQNLVDNEHETTTAKLNSKISNLESISKIVGE